MRLIPVHAPHLSSLEPLESRIAPAAVLPTISADGHRATWTDVDGDKVTLVITKGTLEADGSNFDMEAGPNQGAILQKLDLSASEFKGTAVTITAVRDKVAGGNNAVDIGFLDAHDNSLGAVKINGDLAKIVAGLPSPTAKLPKAVASLSVFSLGQYGALNLDATELGLLTSEITGKMGAVKVRGSVTGVSFSVVGGTFAGIDALTIGGSLIGTAESQSGSFTTTGGIKTVTIKGNFLGGEGQQSGTIEADGKIGTVSILGSIIGGHSGTESNDRSGFLHSDTGFGTITIKGNVSGGTQQSSGVISTSGNVTALTVTGSVQGGKAGTLNGAIEIGGSVGMLRIGGDIAGGDSEQSGYVKIGGTAASVSLGGSVKGGTAFNSGVLSFGTDALDSVALLTIGRDIRGSSGENSGVVESTGPILSATVKGSLLGGSGDSSGAIRSEGFIKLLTVSGSLIGGDLAVDATQDLVESGYVEAARIGAFTLGGSIVTGTNYNATFDLVNSAAIRSANDINTLTIKGSIEGNTDALALITARGQAVLVQDALTDIAINKLTVGGRVSHANILAGYDLNDDITAADANPNAQIVAVTVGNDWIASNLLSGIKLSANLGDGNDALASGVDNPDIDAKIGSILIKGSIAGTATAGDHYGFVAQWIPVFQLGGPALLPTAPGYLLLNTNGGNDNSPSDPKYNLSSSEDTRIFEVALT